MKESPDFDLTVSKSRDDRSNNMKYGISHKITIVLVIVISLIGVPFIYYDKVGSKKLHNEASINVSNLREVRDATASPHQSINVIKFDTNYETTQINQLEENGMKKIHEISFPSRKLTQGKNDTDPQEIKRLKISSIKSRQFDFKKLKKKLSKGVFEPKKFMNTKSAYVIERIPRRIESEEAIVICNKTLFHLEITLDEYPSETSWALVNEETNTVVASQSYMDESSQSAQTFTGCIEPGPYKFSLFDEWGDGIICNESSCYSILIDNVHLIQGHPFASGAVTHVFDSSNPCVIRSMFLLQIHANVFSSSIDWYLRNDISYESIELSQLRSESLQSYFSCLSPGIYSFGIFDADGDKLTCNETIDCYEVLINDKPFIQPDDFSRDKMLSFSISFDRHARKRQCGELPILSPMNHINQFEYDENVEKTLDIIHALSTLDSLNKHHSPQYKAACSILYDSHEISVVNELLVERYAFAVFLNSLNLITEAVLPKNSCDFRGVFCDDEGHITGIDLSENDLHGTIPSEVAHLRYLELLKLSYNQLEGTIPPELGSLTNMKHLDLEENELTGTVPSEIGMLLSLKVLSLGFNKLEGNIPTQIGKFSRLEALFLSYNNFESMIPMEIFNCTRLQMLILSDNLLTGSLPTRIKKLKDLEWLYLSNNNLSGQIPSEIGVLSFLKYLHLELNDFTSLVPEEIGHLHSIEDFFAHDNSLSGTLPQVFNNLTNLGWFIFNHNNFSGQIPDSLWNVSSIRKIELQNNNLHGAVPNDFCSEDKIIRVDGSPWFIEEPSVKCECCHDGESCSLWDIEQATVEGTIRPPCPASNIFYLKFFARSLFWDRLRNIGIESSFGMSHGEKNICISPSGCYWVNHVLGPDLAQTSYTLSYSAKSKSLTRKEGLQETECEAVEICGVPILPTDPKRMGLNHLTQIAVQDLSILEDHSSPAHKALCWIMTEDLLFHDFGVCDGTLLQRYLLVFFYFAQGLSIDVNELSSTHTCDWPGVKCGKASKFIEHLQLSNNNLTGNLLTEIGLLTSLKTLELNKNALHGTIDPILFFNMPHLEVFDVGNNEIRGEIPSKLLKLPHLKILNLSNNSLVGTLPDEITYTKTLEHFDVGNNMLQGHLPNHLFACHQLRIFDLSQNGFTGTIPTLIGGLADLQQIKLSQNRLTGSIPINIFKSTKLHVLMLQSNRITGSIPIQIANLQFAQNITLNHNLLKGTIPTVLVNLRKLEFLHVQHNQITGIAPQMSFAVENKHSFIADCGNPHFLLSAKLSCPSCTMCCNSEDLCQENERKIPIWVRALLATAIVPIGIVILHFCVLRGKKLGFFSWLAICDREPSTIYSEDSTYCFILSPNRKVWLIYFVIAGIQMWLFCVYLQASDMKNEDTDYQFTFRCPDNSMECENQSSVGRNGWFLFFVATLLFLGSDLSMSILQVREAVRLLDIQLFFSGLVLLGLTILTLYTSYVYNVAIAQKNTELITNAVIILFISEMDEKCMEILRIILPEWTNTRVNEINRTMSRRLTSSPPQVTTSSSSSSANPSPTIPNKPSTSPRGSFTAVVFPNPTISDSTTPTPRIASP